MIVATAGHIDHGKTTLVRALTGVNTDRLPEEKARGISIDLGFAYWDIPGADLTVGFVDVPGHERFVHNMLAGVCGIDCAMLVVAADDGVMPQTVEHVHILDLLSVRHGVAVITKIDRVPEERVREVAAQVRALLAPSALGPMEVLPVSTVTAEGLTALRQKLQDLAQGAAPRAREGRFLRFAIDRAFIVAGSGVVVTGTVFNGAVHPGDKVILAPAGTGARVRGIQKNGAAAKQAAAGERCALNLTGLDLADVSRGDWLIAPELSFPTLRMDVRLRVLGSERNPLAHWTPVHLHHGAGDVSARVAIRGGAGIQPGQSRLAQLVVDKPISALIGDRFIVRDQSALRTIGGGVVIDPWPKRRHRNVEQRHAQLDALESADAAAALEALAACSPGGIDIAWFGRGYNLDDKHLSALLQSKDLVVLGKNPPTALPRAAINGVRTKVLDSLARFHASTPQAIGLDMSTLREQCAQEQSSANFGDMLRLFADEGKIEFTGSVARLPRHVATDNPADDKMWGSVQPVLASAGFEGITLRELAASARIDEASLKDFLHRKARTRELMRVTPERFYLRSTLAQFAGIADAVSRASPGGRFRAAQVRDRTNIGRTRVIEILECLDRLGVTQRFGDLRGMRRNFEPILGSAPGEPG